MDDKTISQSQSASFAPADSVRAAYPIPTDITGYKSPIPSGTGAANFAETIKLTPKSVEEIPRGNAVIGSYTINLPHREALFLTNYYCKVLADMAESYQRDHSTAWLELYPGLIIRTQSEKKATPELSTAHLRLYYKKYIRRAVHRVVEYMEVSMVYYASMVNQLIAGRFNGDGPVKTLALAFKWGSLNTVANVFNRFPLAKGVSDWILNTAMFAAGRTNWGVDAIMYPFFNTTILGNRTKHAMTLSDLISSTGKASTAISVADFTQSSWVADNTYKGRAHQLVRHIASALDQYVYAKDAGKKKSERQAVPHMPIVANASMIHLSDTKAGGSGDRNFTISWDSSAVTSEKNNIVAALKETFQFWSEHLTKYYADFCDPNSTFVKFFTTQLPLLEKAKSFKEATNIIQANKTVDLASLSKLMNYRKDNKPNTSTLVKWTPFLSDGTESTTFKYDDFGIVCSDADCAENFERYDCFNENTSAMLFASKAWPRIAPTAFYKLGSDNALADNDGNSFAPFILNAGLTAGKEVVTDKNKSVATLTGKFASVFDRFCCTHYDVETSKLFTVGVAAEDAKKYVEDNTAMVFVESPDDVFVPVQPAIDNSDPFQCGFDIWVDKSTIYDNMWQRYMKDPKSFADSGTNDIFNKTGVFDTQTSGQAQVSTKVSPIPAVSFVETGASATAAAYLPFSERALESQSTMLIFVGQGIFSHPYQLAQLKNSSLPEWSMKGKFVTGTGELDALFSALVSAEYDKHDTSPAAALAYMLTEAASDRISSDEPDVASMRNSAKAAILGFFASDGSENEYREFMFNPAYGPIPICVESQSPQEFAVDTDLTRTGYGSADPDISAYKPKLGYKATGKSITGVMGIDANQSTLRTKLFSVVWSAAQQFAWFISTFKARFVVVDDSNYLSELMDSPFEGYNFMGIPQWATSMLNRAVVSHPGKDDTIPFWSSDATKRVGADLSSETSKLPTGGFIPQIDIVTESRPLKSVGTNISRHPRGTPAHLESESKNAAGAVGQPSGEAYHSTKRPSSNSRNGKKRTKGRGKRQFGSPSTQVQGADVKDSNVIVPGSAASAADKGQIAENTANNKPVAVTSLNM